MKTDIPNAPDATPANGTETPSQLPTGKTELVTLHYYEAPLHHPAPPIVVTDERLVAAAMLGAFSLLGIYCLLRSHMAQD